MNNKSVLRRTVVLLLIFLLTISCSMSLPKSFEDSFGISGNIFFSSDQSGNSEIYSIRVNAKGLAASPWLRLTNNTSDDISPFFMPGNKIGYVSDKNGYYQIYSMALDGSGQTLWGAGDENGYFSPSVSPDGTKVVYVISDDSINSNLYISDLSGKLPEQLTHVWGNDWDPSWSPDGKKVVYTSNSGNDWDIYVINVEDGEITQLTFNSSYDGYPNWSPDGTKILFESDRDGDWDVYVMDADNGENVQAVTENSTGDWLPSWSPDGEWIVYVSNRDGDDEIFIVDKNGENQMKLTNNIAQDRYPIWVP